MEIIIYVFLLVICEIFVLTLLIGLDYYLKSKNCKLVKRSKLMPKSKYGDRNQISKVVFWLHIFNYIYILIYLIACIIITFIYWSLLLHRICIYSLFTYFGLTIIPLIIMVILSPKR